MIYFKWLPERLSAFFGIKGEFDSYSQEWYREVGATIGFTLITKIFIVNFANTMLQGAYACLRYVDRGFRPGVWDYDKHTKQLTQVQYEKINQGTDFLLEDRYANILTVTTICFLFSPGMPILYAIAAIYFFFTYWTDKFLLFNCYKKPVKFDNYIASETI